MQFVVGVLCFLAAAFAFYAPKSRWAEERYRDKFGDEFEEQHARIVRNFRYVGYAWIVMGVLQFLA